MHRRALAFALAVCAAAIHLPAAAQAGYPSKPIRVVVPFAAGSTTDIIARAITDKMAQSMGQPLVVDNRGGASGTIGQAAVAQAAPDGYTIMVHSSSHTVSPHTFAKRRSTPRRTSPGSRRSPAPRTCWSSPLRRTSGPWASCWPPRGPGPAR